VKSLVAACDALGLQAPWEHEKNAVLRGVDPNTGMVSLLTEERRTGATTHMLVEMYLDMEQAALQAGTEKRHKIRFYVVVDSQNFIPTVRGTLRSIHSVLDLDVELNWVEYIPSKVSEGRIRGRKLASWGVFCDHYVKEAAGYSRLSGPWCYTRKIRRIGEGVFQGYDRDGVELGLLNPKGCKDVLRRTQCPITTNFIMAAETVARNEMTYPAYAKDPFLASLDLKRAFEL
jgi:hypothetical protein